MRPKELIKAYVEAFNHCDADALANFYSETAINHPNYSLLFLDHFLS